jgi:hypothetical protein
VTTLLILFFTAQSPIGADTCGSVIDTRAM